MPNYVARDPKELPKKVLVEIVSVIQSMMYAEHDDEGYSWEPDREVSGSDLVEQVGQLMQQYGLVPYEHGPRDWSPRKKR